MPTPTDRLGLDTFDPGEDNWSHTDTVESLDELAVVTDTIANRPSSGTYDGELFLATDQRILYQWDATNTEWDAVSGLGVNGTPIPGTSYFTNLDLSLLTLDSAELTDTTTDPTTNGEFRLNGADVKVQTGGVVKNLSDIGSGSATTEIDLIDIETTNDLPSLDTLSKPTIAYIDGEDDYVGAFQA